MTDAILDILADHAGVDREAFTPDMSLEAAGIDSLAVMEIIFELEERFDIEIPEAEEIDERFSGFKTPADVVQLVSALVEQKETAA